MQGGRGGEPAGRGRGRGRGDNDFGGRGRGGGRGQGPDGRPASGQGFQNTKYSEHAVVRGLHMHVFRFVRVFFFSARFFFLSRSL